MLPPRQVELRWPSSLLVPGTVLIAQDAIAPVGESERGDVASITTLAGIIIPLEDSEIITKIKIDNKTKGLAHSLLQRCEHEGPGRSVMWSTIYLQFC